MGEEIFQTEKPAVLKSFNAAAGSYNQVAVLQHEIAGRLMERLDFINLQPQKLLDLGSGTGRAAKLLGKRYPKALIVLADLALNMLNEARRGWRNPFSRHTYLCADGEQLALNEACVDLVFSNLMLQWCNDPGRVFAEVLRVLRANGLFIFSTFGPGTLAELRESWQAVDGVTHVNSFVDMHDLGDALLRAGFEAPVMETETLTLTYDDGYGCMQELKALGAHNVNRGRRRTLTGKDRIRQMLEAYESRRINGKLPASYEVIYGHAWAPAQPLTKKSGEGVAVFPISKLKKR